MVAAALDVHRQVFGNIKYDLGWTAFQLFFTGAQGLAIYVVMRCRKYAAAKEYWRKRTAEVCFCFFPSNNTGLLQRSSSVIADGISIEE